MNRELLENLLRECECTFLDFKQAQYPPLNSSDEAKSELLKDILALANAEKHSDGYIIIGVEEVRGSRAKILGVTSHFNEADLQQFVNTKLPVPLRFSYEVVDCGGANLGVVKVPVQDGVFFLKADYGKLRRNIVYHRLGSSTAEMAPDEVVRKWERVSKRATYPVFEIMLARIARPVFGSSETNEVVGKVATVSTFKCGAVSERVLNKLSFDALGILAVSSKRSYYLEFAKSARAGLLMCPLGLVLTNLGEVAATDVRVQIRGQKLEGVDLLPQSEYPARPEKPRNFLGYFGNYLAFEDEDVLAKQERGTFCIDWSLPKALPQLRTFSKGFFLLRAFDTASVVLEVAIYAENLPKPAMSELRIDITVAAQDLTAEDLLKYDAAFAKKS